MTSKQLRLGIACLALTALAAFFCTAPLAAQSTTQGSIAGNVVDPTGAAVANAAVAIQNLATNFTTSLATDSSGNFKAPLLEPGTYSVSITAQGFASYRADSVSVVVGQVTTILPHLSVASSTASVVVTEQAPVMNLESPDFSATLNSAALQSIPINNRRWSSLAMTAPGVVSDTSGFGLVSVRGISPVLNNVEIDGADDNQAYYSEERGRTREAYSTSGSAVREFAVNTGVYSAEYGRAAGGVITSVTKSGTNQLHGQAYFWDRQSNWAAYNNYTTMSTLDASSGQYVAQHIKPEDLRKIYGFTAGGALVKDKLFWIYTFDQHVRVFPGTAVPNNPSAFYALPTASANLPNGLTTSLCNLSTGYWSAQGSNSKNANYDPNYTLDSQTCTLAARQRFTSYDQGVNAYKDGIAGLVTDLGSVPRRGYQEINTPKVDWQINGRQHVSFLYHRLRWDAPGDVQTSTAKNYGRDTWGTDFVKLDYGVGKLTSLITNNISNEVLYQYGRELNNEGQLPFTDYTKANLFGTGASAGNVPEVAVNTSAGMYIGSPYYSYRKAMPDERKWQVGDILYWTRGNHSLKFGADEVHNGDVLNNTYESNGYFSYSYFGNYFNDLLNHLNGRANSCNSSASSAATPSGTAVGSYPCYANFYQGFGDPVYAISTMDSGIFVQDNWKIRPRLTFELGLRWDYEALPGPDSNLTTAAGSFVPYPQLTYHPSDKNNFGPRIGFAYNLFGSGNTVLRGGYGIYYGRINNGELLNIRLNTGSPNGQYTTTWKPNYSGAPQFPNIVTGAGAAASKPTSNFLAANLQNPQVQEFDLALQQAVGKGTVLSLNYLGSLGRELPNFLDLNLNPARTLITVTVSDPTNKGPLGSDGTTFTAPQYSSYGNTSLFGSVASNFQVITEMTSNVNSNYHAFVAEIQNRTLRSVQFDASYTWSHALDFAQNANTASTGVNSWYDPYSNARINYGNSDYDTPNRFVGYALYNLPNLRVQNLLKWFANGWSLSDSFQMSNGFPYSVGVTNYFSAGILNGWNGASGPAILPMIGRNTMRYPRHIVDDARIQKEFSFNEARPYRLQLMANFFNIANHQNIDGLGTTAYKLSTSGSGSSAINYATYQGQGPSNPSNNTYQIPTSSNNSGFLFTPREIEITARLNF